MSDDNSSGYRLLESEPVYRGTVIRVRRDVVAMPAGGEAPRDVVEHPGAVGVVTLDDDGRVLLIRQYRHPVGRHLWELPAGLLDKTHETALAAAQRELREEAGLRAGRWDVLVDALSSPGMSDEAVRVYLGRDISEMPAGERHAGVEEEADLTPDWLPLDDAVRLVLAGRIENAMAVMGLLAAARARDTGYADLRPATADWPAKPGRAG